VEQAIGKDCGSGEKQPDGLVAVECFALRFAADDALALDGVVFELVVHTYLRLAI
jgi:hypothetical protein